MANNFKLLNTGRTYFVSKSGHDSNDGLTPDTPKKSIIDNCLVGAGNYDLSTTGYIYYAIGDGKVIFDYKGTMPSLYFYGYENIELVNAVNPPDRYSSQGTGGFLNCIIKNCNISVAMSSSGRFRSYDYTIITNSDIRLGVGSGRHNYCILQNSQSGSTSTGSTLKNSYLSRDSVFTVGHAGTIFNSNIQGIIKIWGTYFNDSVARNYAVQDQLLGTPQDNGYDIDVKWLTVANLLADGYNAQTTTISGYIPTLMNRDPKFNNASIGDFTLQAGSPHIGASDDGSNIGGTSVAISIYNTDTNTAQIIPSSTIDVSNPNYYVVKAGETEGYIDYIQKIGTSDLVLNEIDPVTSLEFNSDIAGGNIGNQNVPDSEPLTFEYPRKLTTTSVAADALTLNVTAHDVAVGEFVRVAGEDREVLSTTADTITVDVEFRAIVGTGVIFQAGEEVRIGALNPNRLTFMMRTSKENTQPTIDSQWDNDIAPEYNKAGVFLTQEWGEIPGYYIDTSNNAVWGSGDSETPVGLTKNEISCKWIHIRVYIRNNYES